MVKKRESSVAARASSGCSAGWGLGRGAVDMTLFLANSADRAKGIFSGWGGWRDEEGHGGFRLSHGATILEREWRNSLRAAAM